VTRPATFTLGLAAFLLGVTACGVPADDTAQALDPAAAPYRVVTRDHVAPPVGSHRAVIYLVRDDAVVPVPRRMKVQPTPTEVLRTLSAGPTHVEREQGLRTALPIEDDPRVLRIAHQVVTLSLPTTTETSNRSDAVLGFAQLVLTLTALPEVAGVAFETDGRPLQVPRADGSVSTEPLGRVDYRELIDPS
jgi:spore germination protein GerM